MPLRSASSLVAALLVGALATIAPPASAAAGDKVFDIVAPFDIAGADPSQSGFIFLQMEVGETLVSIDAEGKPQPDLATGWTVSPDGLAWCFAVRQGVRFHDGTVLTAALAAASLNHAMSKPGVLEKARIESIAAEGDEVVIRLAEPFAPLWSLLAHFSTIVLAPSSFAPDGRVETVVATGPYRLSALEAPQRMTVEAFPDYRGGSPAIGAATYLAAGRGETRTRMVESGDADMAFTLDRPSIARLAASGAAKVLKAPSTRVMQIKVNAAVPPFDTTDGRAALSEAIEREAITRAVLRAPGTSASQLFPPSLTAWHDPALAPLATDPERAKRRLARLGWTPGTDGILSKNGRRLQIRLQTYPDRPELSLTATALQEQFEEIGIDVDVVVADASSIPAGHRDGTLQLALAARNYALVPDPFVTLLGDFREGGSDWGPMNWNDPVFQAAMTALLASDEPAGQARLRHEIAGLLQAELPVIPVVWYEQTMAVTKAVEGAAIDPFERSFGLSKMRWKP